MSPFSRPGCMLLACSLVAFGVWSAFAEEPQAELPKATVRFDGHTLRLASAGSNKAMTLMEFFPEGQTLDDWTNMAAIHVYSEPRIGPRKRAEAMVAYIMKTHPEVPVESQDSPDAKQVVVSFAVWDAAKRLVEFNVFAFGTSGEGTDVGLQYAVRRNAEWQDFLRQDMQPLRERLVRMILRDGMNMSPESDLTAVRLALSPDDKAICDRILENDADGLDAVLASPDERAAVVLLVAAAVAFNGQRLEDSGFLLYCGQLRLRFDEQCFPPKETEGENPVVSIRGYALQLGESIDPALADEPAVLSAALARVGRWKPRVPAGYSPGYESERRLTEEEALAATQPQQDEFLGRLNGLATLLNDEEYFAAIQVAKRLRVPGEERLPTKEEHAAARKTMARIEAKRGVVWFGEQ